MTTPTSTFAATWQLHGTYLLPTQWHITELTRAAARLRLGDFKLIFHLHDPTQPIHTPPTVHSVAHSRLLLHSSPLLSLLPPHTVPPYPAIPLRCSAASFALLADILYCTSIHLSVHSTVNLASAIALLHAHHLHHVASLMLRHLSTRALPRAAMCATARLLVLYPSDSFFPPVWLRIANILLPTLRDIHDLSHLLVASTNSLTLGLRVLQHLRQLNYPRNIRDILILLPTLRGISVPRIHAERIAAMIAHEVLMLDEQRTSPELHNIQEGETAAVGNIETFGRERPGVDITQDPSQPAALSQLWLLIAQTNLLQSVLRALRDSGGRTWGARRRVEVMLGFAERGISSDNEMLELLRKFEDDEIDGEDLFREGSAMRSWSGRAVRLAGLGLFFESGWRGCDAVVLVVHITGSGRGRNETIQKDGCVGDVRLTVRARRNSDEHGQVMTTCGARKGRAVRLEWRRLRKGCVCGRHGWEDKTRRVIVAENGVARDEEGEEDMEGNTEDIDGREEEENSGVLWDVSEEQWVRTVVMLRGADRRRWFDDHDEGCEMVLRVVGTGIDEEGLDTEEIQPITRRDMSY